VGTKTTFVPCKGCHEVVEVPLPDPEKVIVTEPCKCGMTENTRMSRHWATAAALVIVTIAIGTAGSCVADKHYEVGKITAETEKLKVQIIANQKEMETMTAELQKYKSFFEEWKKLPGNPASPERSPIDPRAPHPLQAPVPEKK